MLLHERPAVRVAPRYDVDTLGAPFRVTVLDAVTFNIDPATGEEIVQIPDVVGLIKAVVRCRVRDTRKLNGTELKFIRNSIGVRAKSLSTFLDMTPEHLSRCESNAKVMSTSSEKMLRLFAYIATYMPEPEELLLRSIDGDELKKQSSKPDEMVNKFFHDFLSMRIQSAFDPTEELHYEFLRRTKVKGEEDEPISDDEDEWSPDDIAA